MAAGTHSLLRFLFPCLLFSCALPSSSPPVHRKPYRDIERASSSSAPAASANPRLHVAGQTIVRFSNARAQAYAHAHAHTLICICPPAPATASSITIASAWIPFWCGECGTAHPKSFSPAYQRTSQQPMAFTWFSCPGCSVPSGGCLGWRLKRINPSTRRIPGRRTQPLLHSNSRFIPTTLLITFASICKVVSNHES
jgi:hypothetical protein